MFKKILLAGSALFFSVTICSTVSAKSGVSQGTSLPNGKPFQTIQNYLDDIQAQIDAVVGHVDSLEDRVTALETAVADLQAQDAELLLLIEQNTDDVVDLQAQFDANETLITAMQVEISNLTFLVNEKQNIVDGTCMPGSSIRVINPDGSVACEIDDASSAVQRVRVSNSLDLAAALLTGWTGLVTATCPSGYTLTGGGFSTSADTVYVNSYPSGTLNQWNVYGINNTPFLGQSIFAYANCIKFE
jgi:hypothetical protein